MPGGGFEGLWGGLGGQKEASTSRRGKKRRHTGQVNAQVNAHRSMFFLSKGLKNTICGRGGESFPGGGVP